MPERNDSDFVYEGGQLLRLVFIPILLVLIGDEVDIHSFVMFQGAKNVPSVDHIADNTCFRTVLTDKQNLFHGVVTGVGFRSGLCR